MGGGAASAPNRAAPLATVLELPAHAYAPPTRRTHTHTHLIAWARHRRADGAASLWGGEGGGGEASRERGGCSVGRALLLHPHQKKKTAAAARGRRVSHLADAMDACIGEGGTRSSGGAHTQGETKSDESASAAASGEFSCTHRPSLSPAVTMMEKRAICSLSLSLCSLTARAQCRPPPPSGRGGQNESRHPSCARAAPSGRPARLGRPRRAGASEECGKGGKNVSAGKTKTKTEKEKKQSFF